MIETPVTVFDCGVFLQGLLSKSGPAVRCLELFENGQIRLVISEEVLAEITDVLSRPKLFRKIKIVNPVEFLQIIEKLG